MLDFATDGRDWPNREHSRFVPTRSCRWHVQRAGSGPTLLLLHGTGAGTFSWRHLLPGLARDFDVIAPDLPGHAFTTVLDPEALSTAGMARAVAELCDALGIAPTLGVGHSAGAAVLVRMSLDGLLRPRALAGLSPALVPPPAAWRMVAAPVGALVRLPFVAGLAARSGRTSDTVRRLLEPTGSPLDRIELAWYARLFREPAHVAAGLAMMSRWDLATLVRHAARLTVPLALLAPRGDGFVPFRDLAAVAARLPAARLVPVDGAGHLFHEERPADALALLRTALAP